MLLHCCLPVVVGRKEERLFSSSTAPLPLDSAIRSLPSRPVTRAAQRFLSGPSASIRGNAKGGAAGT
jgi:hypothetical protein